VERALELDAETLGRLERARALEKHAVGRLISLVEHDGEDTAPRRAALFRWLRSAGVPDRARIVGITGTPGTGKSSLIGRLCLDLVARDAEIRIAVLAVDPSSPRSGGALLGDRIRTSFPVDECRIFFRSQASRGDLGGIGRRTFAATRLLRHLVDLLLIETVGIGQSEVDVTRLADRTALVMQPLSGDHVQFMKAGIMEVPDVFVVNKCDEEALARRSLLELTSSLEFARVGQPGGEPPRIFQTSAKTGLGIEELAGYLHAEAKVAPDPERRRSQERYFLEKRIADGWGRCGLTASAGVLDAAMAAPVARWSYDETEAAAIAAVRARLRPAEGPS
jgi:LAO/AO transport system kinase